MLPIVTFEFANCELETPPDFIDTSPAETEKLAELNDAAPLTVVLASLIEIVTVSFVTAVSIGSVPVNVKVPPVLNESVPVSPTIVNELAAGAVQDATPDPLVVKIYPDEPSTLGNV